VVAKQARVVEEVVVHKEATEHVETIHDTVRRTDVEVEQGQAHQESSFRSFDTYDADFRQHFNTTFAQQQGATYDAYIPAYRYGYTLATDKRTATVTGPCLSQRLAAIGSKDSQGPGAVQSCYPAWLG